jgi:transcriptional regulator with XRE-family HTH domain
MKDNWMQNFAVFVKDQRRKMGMSQSDLAEATDMNTSYISRLENGGSFQSVKIDFFIKLADTFEMTDMEIMQLVGLR